MGNKIDKEVIRANAAPAPVGPYNQAIAATTTRMLFLAGQIPLDPATGKLISGTVAEQTERVLQNIKAVLAAAGVDFSNVVKTTVFLADMADFPEMNGVYGRYFQDPAPARSTVQVARLPMDARVEIECTAVI